MMISLPTINTATEHKTLPVYSATRYTYRYGIW